MAERGEYQERPCREYYSYHIREKTVEREKKRDFQLRFKKVQGCLLDSRPKRVFIKEHLPLNKGNKPDILALEKEAAAAME